jgi:hypothetical protein
MGSAIINSILICSIDTLYLLMFSLVLRYFMSIYLLLFLLSLFLKRENCSRIIVEDLYGCNYKIDNFETFNKISQLSCLCSEFIACNNFSFHGRRSNCNLFTASLGYSIFNNKKIYPEVDFLLSTYSAKFKSE